MDVAWFINNDIPTSSATWKLHSVWKGSDPPSTSMHCQAFEALLRMDFQLPSQLCNFKTYKLIHRSQGCKCWPFLDNVTFIQSLVSIGFLLLGGSMASDSCMASYDNDVALRWSRWVKLNKKEKSQNLNLVGCQEWFNRMLRNLTPIIWILLGEVLFVIV